MNAFVLILAAGGSTRFDGVKALAPWSGGTLLSKAITTASSACADRIAIVTGAHADLLRPHLPPNMEAHNIAWHDGLGGSIACGIRAALQRDANIDCLIILPVDQPFVTEDHLARLTALALEKRCCVLTKDDQASGPPAAVPREAFDLLLFCKGDRGLKAVLHDNGYETVNAPGMLRDIDTKNDLDLFSTI